MSPTPDVILTEVRRILSEELAVSGPVAPDNKLAGIAELDSVGLVTLAVSLEDRFRVKLTGRDAEGIATVRDLINLVERRLAEKGP